jgi:hypothetical protein
LYVGQRVSDAARIERTKTGFVRITQGKTNVNLELPIHQDLLASIKACEAKGSNIIGGPLAMVVR